MSHNTSTMQHQEEQPKQRPHESDGFDQYQHSQIKAQPAIVKQLPLTGITGFPLLIRHGPQKSAIDTGHSQIRAESVVPVHFRNARKKPKRRRHQGHDDRIPALQTAQQRQQERKIHHIVTRKSKSLPEVPGIKMQKPPLDQLPTGRIISEFRSCISIFSRKTVQVIEGFHIRRPEIDVIPPRHHLARRTQYHR